MYFVHFFYNYVKTKYSWNIHISVHTYLCIWSDKERYHKTCKAVQTRTGIYAMSADCGRRRLKIKLIRARRGRPEKKHFDINDFLNFIVAHSFSIKRRCPLHVTRFVDGHLLCATYETAGFVSPTLINKK